MSNKLQTLQGFLENNWNWHKEQYPEVCEIKPISLCKFAQGE